MMTVSLRVNLKRLEEHSTPLWAWVSEKNGLTVAACNIIFWMVIILILTYGCELWLLSASNVQKLEIFQRYAGWKVQQLHCRSPSERCFNGIGWMRIERFIQVKKMLFIRTILKMDDKPIIRNIFIAQFKVFANDIDKHTKKQFMSPVFDMMSVSIIFDFLPIINDAVLTGVVPSKKVWANLVWSRAWRLEDKIWASNGILNGGSIFRCVCGTSHCISWWSLSDVRPHLRRMWQIMVKIICNSSMLKSDDLSLKGSHDSLKFCSNCDLGIVQSAWHIIMQCPNNHREIVRMYSELSNIEDGSWEYAKKYANDILCVVLGCEQPALDAQQCYTIWEITGKTVFDIYQKVVSHREGEG